MPTHSLVPINRKSRTNNFQQQQRKAERTNPNNKTRTSNQNGGKNAITLSVRQIHVWKAILKMSDFMNEELIEEVKKHEILYNKKKPGYKNKKKKSEIWRQIGQILGKPDDACIKRWRSLRDTFLKHLKKRNSNLDGDKFDGGSWGLFDNLFFLKDHVRPRKRKPEEIIFEMHADDADVKNIEEEMFQEVVNSNSNQELSSPSPIPAKKIKTTPSETAANIAELNKTFSAAADMFSKLCKQPENPEGREITLFLEFIGLKLSRLSPHCQNKAMLDIMNYVVKLENVEGGYAIEIPMLE